MADNREENEQIRVQVREAFKDIMTFVESLLLEKDYNRAYTVVMDLREIPEANSKTGEVT